MILYTRTLIKFFPPQILLLALVFALPLFSRAEGGLQAFLAIVLVIFSIYTTGAIFNECITKVKSKNSFVLYFLMGYVTETFIILIISLLFKNQLLLNFYIYTFFITLIYLYKFNYINSTQNKYGNCAIFLSIIFIYIWLSDAIFSPELMDNVYVYKVWQDIFLHTIQINSIKYSHGFIDLQHTLLYGVNAPPYHIGAYIIPALISSIGNISSITTYTLVLQPIGLILMSLSGYLLLSSFFSERTSLFATLGLLILPDPSHLGLKSYYLSFSWIIQSTPALPYSIGCAAFSFYLLNEGLKSKRLRVTLSSYFFILATAIFKIHIFITTIYIFIICNIFGGQKLSRKVKVALFLLLNFTFIFIYIVYQKYPQLPTLRIDFADYLIYLNNIISSTDNLFISDIYTNFKNQYTTRLIYNLIILIATFGPYFPLYIYLSKGSAFRGKYFLYFPLLVITNYLVMTNFLAINISGVGTKDEFLHRPFAWAYFILLLWFCAAAVGYLENSRIRITKIAPLVIGLLILVTGMLFIFKRDIQIVRFWGQGYQSIPACIHLSTNFVRKEQRDGKSILDGQYDQLGIVSALSELHPYLIKPNFPVGFNAQNEIDRRLTEIEAAKNSRDKVFIQTFMKERKITYYLSHLGKADPWFNTLNENLVFTCQDIYLYKF